MRTARDEARAELARVREVLRSVEWSSRIIIDYDGMSVAGCPWCEGVGPGDVPLLGKSNARRGHAADCELAAALGNTTEEAT